MKNKWFYALLTAAIAMQTMIVPVHSEETDTYKFTDYNDIPQQYSDVPPNHKHYAGVSQLKLQGLINLGEVVRPDDTLTNGYMMHVLAHSHFAFGRKVNDFNYVEGDVVSFEEDAAYLGDSFTTRLRAAKIQTSVGSVVSTISSLMDLDVSNTLRLLEENGTIQYQNGETYHTKRVTRGEFFTLLYNILSLTEADYQEVVEAKEEAGEVEYANPIQKVSLGLYEPKRAFTDVRTDYHGYKQIHLMRDYGLINGYEDNSFRQGKDISRQHGAALIYRAVQKGYIQLEYVREGIQFKDVKPSDTYYSAIDALYRAGAMEAPNGYANPQKQMTRYEMAQALVVGFGLQGGARHYVPFADVTNQKYLPYVQDLAHVDVTTGDNGLFKGDENLSRGNYAVFMHRALMAQKAGNQYAFKTNGVDYENLDYSGQNNQVSRLAGPADYMNEPADLSWFNHPTDRMAIRMELAKAYQKSTYAKADMFTNVVKKYMGIGGISTIEPNSDYWATTQLGFNTKEEAEQALHYLLRPDTPYIVYNPQREVYFGIHFNLDGSMEFAFSSIPHNKLYVLQEAINQ